MNGKQRKELCDGKDMGKQDQVQIIELSTTELPAPQRGTSQLAGKHFESQAVQSLIGTSGTLIRAVSMCVRMPRLMAALC